MRLQNTLMTEKLADKMDNLLKMATPENMRVYAPVTNKSELNEYTAIGELLDNLGYAKRMGGNLFNITPAGMLFVKNGGFTTMYQQQKEKNENEEEIARLNRELTLLQIKNAKRERILALWGIISTLAALILAYLQFAKSVF